LTELNTIIGLEQELKYIGLVAGYYNKKTGFI